MNSEERMTKIVNSQREINQAIYSVLMLIAKRYDITPSQLLVLRLLKERPEITLSEMSEELHMSPSTASGIIDRMEKAELISRDRRGTDRRALKLELTDKGLQQWSETNATGNEMLKPVLELSEDEHLAFLCIQQKLLQILQKIIRED